MLSGVAVLLFFVVLNSGGGHSVPVFLVTSPKSARLDTATTFSVSASNVTQLETVHLRLKTSDSSEVVLNETTLAFETSGVQTWNVVIDSATVAQCDQTGVKLHAEHRSVAEEIDVLLNLQSGYIMIQTDKVIYTPRQTVMYRVIALDDDQRFARWPVTIEIKNPHNIIVDRRQHSSEEAFVGRNFTLPRGATAGQWSVSAYYDESKVRTKEIVSFTVEKYVLPTFKVEVSAVEKVISDDGITPYIQVNTKAVYSYGEAVQGTVQLKLGVYSKGSEFVSLFNTTYQGQLDSRGIWTHYVPVADMRSHSDWFPDGSQLYLMTNVTEAGTGEVGTGVAMDTVFANTYYKIDFSGSKKYFKPGLYYTLVVDVVAANGDPASNINVWIEVHTREGFNRTERFYNQLMLDGQGRMNHTFAVPALATALEIKVYIQDPRTRAWWPLKEKQYNVTRFPSSTSTYIHLEEESGNRIGLHYTPPSTSYNDSITVLIISKERLIYQVSVPRDSSGSASLPFSQEVLLAASPSARVVAYFCVPDGRETEIVSDSLFIDTEDQCRHDLRVNSGGFSFGPPLPKLPKQRTGLIISGAPSMRVGLLAVDKAVYFLRDERSLTREKVFEMLGLFDDRRGIGDGSDSEEIFEHAGLQFTMLREEHPVTAPHDAVYDMSHAEIAVQQMAGYADLHEWESSITEERIPVEQVRKYFPESWLFKEITLRPEAYESEDITLPDSITTWAFTAVGVGPEGGVCMSRPHEMVVFKPFFAQLRLPYKAVRLEEVSIDIGIYNYKPFDINVYVSIIGDIGLCFSERSGGRRRIRYRTTLRRNGVHRRSVRVIPLVTGSAQLKVVVRSNNRLETDVVEKTLHVAEGRKVQKSIIFPLDPTGNHSSYQIVNQSGVQTVNTATVTNHINTQRQEQSTVIDLYMPEEIVHGSQQCQISAYGDLMGDVISTAVLDGDSLFENMVVDAEDAIGNLAPAVHALLYLNNSEVTNPHVNEKGRAIVTYGVSNLLTYRKPESHQIGSFSLTTDSPPASWLTALVLKTLCHAERITFIDHGSLIGQGFTWLLDQVRTNGTLEEQDRRLAQPSVEYDVMLSAETLIALQECAESRPLTDDDLMLMGHQELLLGRYVDHISSPLVMAKTAYALTLSAPRDAVTLQAVRRLRNMTRTTPEGLNYWSVTSENEPPQRPFWYHSGTKASSIEATAYALLVFHRQAQAAADSDYNYDYDYDYGKEEEEEEEEEALDLDVNLDSIAGWLIQKRNNRGAFIGAMDTAAATQALSLYTMTKHNLQDVNLHCSVTTSPAHNFTHTFDFNTDNAILPKSLSNVPVGRQLEVVTQGIGLGQMQVQVEYNVPVVPNAHCSYNVTITRRTTTYNRYSDPSNKLCRYCNMGCDDDKSNQRRRRSSGSQRRFRRYQAMSSVSICLEVCLRSAENVYADRTIAEVGMLSGFEPFDEDLQQIKDRKERYLLSGLEWVPEKTAVVLKFNQVPHNQSTCISFRAKEIHDIRRRYPATVTVRSHEDQEPTCVEKYNPVVSEVILPVYCANRQNSNQGQCRCFSGTCGKCHLSENRISLTHIHNLVCGSEYIYKISQTSRTYSDDWVDVIANVLETKKNGTMPTETEINLVTSRTCSCPVSMGLDNSHYFFGSHVNTLVDRNNKQTKTYLADQTTAFVSTNGDRTGNFIEMVMGIQC